MSLKNCRVTVVIPLYKEVLPILELKILENNLEKLENYRVVFVVPHTLDLSQFFEQMGRDDFEIIRVTDEWLGRKNGISGYNRMMLSSDFYKLFSDCEYILICHTDAYIFRDELEDWCNKGFDCVAAPWVKRPIYNFPIIWAYMWIRRKLCSSYLHHLKQEVYGRIGNGGLSLRKVESFVAAAQKYRDEIDFFNKNNHHLYHEDVFWALIPKEFSYPNQFEAMKFSMDTNPKYCYNVNGKKLPFGCHGLTRRRLYSFWKDFIF